MVWNKGCSRVARGVAAMGGAHWSLSDRGRTTFLNPRFRSKVDLAPAVRGGSGDRGKSPGQSWWGVRRARRVSQIHFD